MKTFKFNQLSRKAKKTAINAAREYLKEQFDRCGTPEWQPTKRNAITEAGEFIYNADGEAYDVIGDAKESHAGINDY